MSYAAAIENLSALIPELFSTPGTPGSTRRKFSLMEIGILCTALGDPQHSFPSVLVAGTNGKGSTASTLASIARESGLQVGLYTSPHLDRVNERIRLLQPRPGAPGLDSETWDSTDIPDDDFARVYFRVHAAAEQAVLDHDLEHLPSYFELLTALAFQYFAESKVDLAVLEVGMGGRLDATNIVAPVLSVITDISLDHQEWLGETIDLIAREKAGILRPNGVLVTLPQHPEANQALGEVATELNVRGINAAQYTPQIGVSSTAPYPIQVLGEEILVDSPLKGAHQHRNIALAVAAAVELAQDLSFPITPSAIERGIQNTRWPGRLERLALPASPEFILDVAHNPAGAWALRSALNSSENAGAPGLASETWESSTENVGAPGLALETWEGSTENAGAPGLASETWESSVENVGAPGLALETWESSAANAGAPGLALETWEGSTANAGAPGLASETWESSAANAGAPGLALETWEGSTANAGAPHLASETWESSAANAGAPHLASEMWDGDAPHGTVLIFACLRDKPLREMTQILFPIFDHVVLAPIHSPRATEVADLLAAAEATGVPSTPSATVEEAIQIALALNPAKIVISGSVYLVGEARHILLNPAQAQEDRIR
jgi:dihydrofolate synthase / folylpolyglutamate synthase